MIYLSFFLYCLLKLYHINSRLSEKSGRERYRHSVSRGQQSGQEKDRDGSLLGTGAVRKPHLL